MSKIVEFFCLSDRFFVELNLCTMFFIKHAIQHCFRLTFWGLGISTHHRLFTSHPIPALMYSAVSIPWNLKLTMKPGVLFCVEKEHCYYFEQRYSRVLLLFCYEVEHCCYFVWRRSTVAILFWGRALLLFYFDEEHCYYVLYEVWKLLQVTVLLNCTRKEHFRKLRLAKSSILEYLQYSKFNHAKVNCRSRKLSLFRLHFIFKYLSYRSPATVPLNL